MKIINATGSFLVIILWVFMAMFIVISGFSPVKGRYVSGDTWIETDSQAVFYHQLGTRPLELDIWCSLFLVSTNKSDSVGPAVPCSEYESAKIQVIAVTSTYVSLWNYGPSRVIVNVVASP